MPHVLAVQLIVVQLFCAVAVPMQSERLMLIPAPLGATAQSSSDDAPAERQSVQEDLFAGPEVASFKADDASFKPTALRVGVMPTRSNVSLVMRPALVLLHPTLHSERVLLQV
jgi:hypothetical protein